MFFDATLSFLKKLSYWRIQKATLLQLVTDVMLLSLAAVASLR